MIASRFEVRPLRVQLVPIIFTLFALAMPGYYIPADPTLATWIRVLVPAGCALGIVVVLMFFWKSRHRRIVVDDDGIHDHGVLGTREVAWDAITRYRYLSVAQPAVAHGRGGAGMLGLVTGAMAEAAAQRSSADNRHFGLGYIELYTNDSAKPFRIGKHTFFGPRRGYVELSELVELVLEELHRRFASRSPSFLPFTLERDRLRHETAASIELADIDHVRLADGRIRISSRSSGPWIAARMKTIDNSMLLVQELAARGVELQLSPEVLVPETTLRMLSRDR